MSYNTKHTELTGGKKHPGRIFGKLRDCFAKATALRLQTITNNKND